MQFVCVCVLFLSQTEMFYSLQQQMASLLNVDPDLIGLYLNDCRLAAIDTPQSTQLHLADIIGAWCLYWSHVEFLHSASYCILLYGVDWAQNTYLLTVDFLVKDYPHERPALF